MKKLTRTELYLSLLLFLGGYALPGQAVQSKVVSDETSALRNYETNALRNAASSGEHSLSGQFVSWEGEVLVTNLGRYKVDSTVQLDDRAKTRSGMVQAQGGKRPTVQLLFSNGQLKKVIIY